METGYQSTLGEGSATIESVSTSNSHQFYHAMLPIPLIHLLAIPMGLLGPPIAFFAVFKLYGGSRETKGSAPCPSCGAAIDLTFQIDRWPIQEICSSCRESCVVDKAG